ncbi:MerR family transcriptional regulator [Pseudonocardia hispaniensis]|uniref:MerR family transcriptional regulator n=1 Tax=Pseudonocardia hispaniensis TaxID=904933 RepID=A0ABW1J4Q0_9PSEU
MAAPSPPSPSAQPAEPESLTIDELAERSGITVRTIRFYAGRGLLPPPRLRGRTGLYGPAHLARLELVSELSALGFTLAAIERYLQRIPPAAAAEELALQRALLSPWVPEQIEEVDRADLELRTGRPLDDDALAALEALGVLERLESGRMRLRGPLGPGLDMLDSGLPTHLLRDSYELIEKHTTALAEDLMALFQRQVLQPYRDAGRPAEERSRLAAMLSRLKPITVQGIVTAFGRAVNQTIRDRIG